MHVVEEDASSRLSKIPTFQHPTNSGTSKTSNSKVDCETFEIPELLVSSACGIGTGLQPPASSGVGQRSATTTYAFFKLAVSIFTATSVAFCNVRSNNVPQCNSPPTTDWISARNGSDR
jgi:hypothetical protein